jgi:hypothetical protein
VSAKDEQTSLRLPADLLERATKLQAAMNRKGLPLNRSDVLRMALERGLKALASDYK